MLTTDRKCGSRFNMARDLTFFREILVWAFDQSRPSYVAPDDNLGLIIGETYQRYRPIMDSATLERCLPTEDRTNASFADLGVFLYLRPPNRASNTVPIISVRSDFGRSLPEVRIQLLLFVLDEHANLQSLGYRFETPEGPGRHNFYHIQPIRTLFGMPNAPATTTPAWFPDTHPTFPIDATDPVSLPFNLLISLYGFACTELNPSALSTTLRQHLGSMLCHNPKPVRYWKVASNNRTFYYQSWHSRPQFEAFCAKTFQGRRRISQIDFSDYSEVPANERRTC